MPAITESQTIEDIELDLLKEGIFRHYGFDFRNYALASLRRRIRMFISDEQISTISLLQDRILHDKESLDRLLYSITVNSTAIFRDPQFYLTFREEVVPLLRTYPFIRIWIAGASTGEEVYSLAIMLEEEGIYDRCRIYATDINEVIIKKAKQGVYPLDLMEACTSNYVKSGGTRSFADYYSLEGKNAVMDSSLSSNVVFAQHNLATDASFNEFHVILCRNVMIYFNRELQAQVLQLLHESLVMFGILGLGSRENMKLSRNEYAYEELSSAARLYRRIA